jgi:bifunctional UDP-N-acetylglucosamine pyrophosphorylase/glucosamine-1-phosphate N-acetyltransferase
VSATSTQPTEGIAAIVLAAGQGKRMKSDLPKVLHKVGGAALVEYPLDALKGAGVAAERTVVVLGVGRELVEQYLTKAKRAVRFATQEKPLGTAHAVLSAKGALDGFKGEILVLSGDAPCLQAETVASLLKAHREGGASATVVTGRVPNPKGYGRIVRDGEARIAAIVEEKDATAEQRRIAEINSGMYAFQADALWGAVARVKNENQAGEFYLTDVVRILLGDGRKVGTVEAPFEETEGVNDRKQLAEQAAIIRRRILDRLMAEGVTILDPGTTYVEGDVEVGRDTIIEPFSVIRRGARIGSGCHIGPFAHIADGAILEDGAEVGNFVEVKRTRMRKKAKAKHLAYLGDGDIGERANIGAGTIFCNYDGKNKSATKVGEKAFIGSGSLLVAPVEIGAGATTGAGAVVTRGKSVPSGEVWVGMPAKPIRKGGEGEKRA